MEGWKVGKVVKKAQGARRERIGCQNYDVRGQKSEVRSRRQKSAVQYSGGFIYC